MAILKKSTSNLSALSNALDEHLVRLRQSILDRAHELSQATLTPADSADGNPDTSPTLQQLNQACSEVILGKITPTGHPIFQYFPPFTIVCTFLCLSFAILGVWAMSGTSAPNELAKASGGFLDIAKIFAGAIVGSTASTVLASARGRQVR